MPVINKQLIKELKVQTELMDEPEKLTVIAKLTHPLVEWEWYLICFNSEFEDEIYCILDGMESEYGVVGLKEINTHKPQGLPFEIQKNFKPCNAQALFLELKKITV